MPENKKAAITFIFITLLIDVIGLGIIIPVLPDLIRELTRGTTSEAATYGGWLLFAYASMQFVFAPILGGLSDQFGRRPVLLFSLLGFGLDYLLQALAPSIAWLFIGRLIAGVMGASFTTASAYIADISTPEKRAQNFGMIGVAFGLGFIIGPVLGGILGAYGARVPFYAAACLSLINCIYGFFVLPESLDKKNRRPFNWKRANPFGAFEQLKKYPLVAGLAVTFLLITIAGHAVQSNWTFYTEYKFGWDSKMVGYSLGVVGVMIAVVQGGMTRVLVPKLGNARAAIIGIWLYLIGNILFAFAWNGWMMLVFLVPYAFGGLAMPSLQGLMSNAVPDTEQGELQGVLTSIMSLSSIIGPPLMTNLFAYFTKEAAPLQFPGAPFIMAAVLCLFCVITASISFKKNIPGSKA